MAERQETEITRRQLDTDAGEPAAQVAQVVAEMEGKDVTEVPNTYGCLDHVLDHIFENPPSPDANLEVAFDYEGYRVVVRQDGTARFVEDG